MFSCSTPGEQPDNTTTAPAAHSGRLLEIVVDNGAIFLDIADRPILAFRPGAFLAIGSLEVLGARESERRYESAVAIGKCVGRTAAEKIGNERMEQALQACEDRFRRFPGTGLPGAAS